MTKEDHSKELIANGYKANPSGVIAWSGGKDSMVLLHLMRSMGIDLPLIFFREQWQPWKYKFHDDLIHKWGLKVLTWHPSKSTFQQEGDEFEVQNYYQINSTLMTCPTGIVEMDENLPWVCVHEIATRPKQGPLFIDKLDCVWIGHKGCDSDPILGGDAGTRVEARLVPGQAMMYYPLRDWTHNDVWKYIEKHNVPYDASRYEKVDGKWGEKQNKKHNVDYVHACTRCIDRRPNAAKFVDCPKLKMKIENVSGMIPWDEQKKLSYMED